MKTNKKASIVFFSFVLLLSACKSQLEFVEPLNGNLNLPQVDGSPDFTTPINQAASGSNNSLSLPLVLQILLGLRPPLQGPRLVPQFPMGLFLGSSPFPLTIPTQTTNVTPTIVDVPRRFNIHEVPVFDSEFDAPVALGQVDRIATRDVIIGVNAGKPPRVTVNTVFGDLFQFDAYAREFLGGVFVAACNVDGDADGIDEIITGPGNGGGSHIRVWKVHGGLHVTLMGEFFAYDAHFTGGSSVAGTDWDNDGRCDIVTGAGRDGGPHVKVFKFRPEAPNHPHVLASFMAYDPKFTGGIFVAGGDVNGDGIGDVVTGARIGGGPHVKAFSGADLSEIHSFFPYNHHLRTGVRVAAADLNLDGFAEIITAPGPSAETSVTKVFSGRDLTLLRKIIVPIAPTNPTGLYVAARTEDLTVPAIAVGIDPNPPFFYSDVYSQLTFWTHPATVADCPPGTAILGARCVLIDTCENLFPAHVVVPGHANTQVCQLRDTFAQAQCSATGGTVGYVFESFQFANKPLLSGKPVCVPKQACDEAPQILLDSLGFPHRFSAHLRCGV